MNHRFTWTLALFIGAGLAQVTACEEEVTTPEAEQACADYCMVAKECDDDLDQLECEDNCREQLANCFESQLDDAIEELRACERSDSCTDVLGCSFEAGAECFFGI